MIQFLKDITRPIRRPFKRWRIEFIKRYWVKKYSEYLYRIQLGKEINWKNPIDLNEKINWLAFHTDTSEWTRLSDKFLVREFIKKRGCGDILIPLIGKWNSLDEVEWATLPDNYVLKTNCGSGDTTIIRESKQTKPTDVTLSRIHFALKNRFGLETAEPHYLRIEPCIIAEQLLQTKDGSSITDYKIWCFNGKPYCFFVCSNRDVVNHTVDFNYYDLEWKRHDEKMAVSYKNTAEVSMPRNIEKLLHYASILSKGFPQVRVDLYEVEDKIYFGEMTFTSLEARMKCFTQDTLNEMGKMIILPSKR